MKRPLAVIAVVFCAGIICGYGIPAPFVYTYSAACVFVACGFLLRGHRNSCFYDILLCGAIFFSSGAIAKNQETLSVRHVFRYLQLQSDKQCMLRGYVASEPYAGAGQASFLFRAVELKKEASWYRCCGNVVVRNKGGEKLEYGDALFIKCNVKCFYLPVFIRSGNQRLFATPQGALTCRLATTVLKKIHLKPFNPCKRLSLRLKSRLRNIIRTYLASLPAKIMHALVLGERRSVPAPINRSMIKSGTVHILVVSGFHVGIIAAAFIGLLQSLQVPRAIRPFLAIFALGFYCMLVGCAPSVVRATVTASVFLCARLFRREADAYNSLAAAAIVILSIHTRQIFDIGFQLSFASVFSIIYLYPRLALFLRVACVRAKPIRYLLRALLVSFSAWVGTMGLIAYYFRIFSPITVIANVLIVPLASLATTTGFLIFGCSVWCPFLCRSFGLASELLINLMLAASAFFIKIPLAYIYLR